MQTYFKMPQYLLVFLELGKWNVCIYMYVYEALQFSDSIYIIYVTVCRNREKESMRESDSFIFLEKTQNLRKFILSLEAEWINTK